MIRVFPVAAEGHPTYSDDFGSVRPGAGKHQGNDIFAAEGTPVVAVDDGALRFAEDPRGGHAFYLRADDGTVYYGAHLSAYEGASPRRASAGEIVGYVGHTGNAATTAPHLHFEVHPSGGVAVDPYRLLAGMTPPSVTSWLGAVDQVLPAPAPPADPLPAIPAPAPVPPIPHASPAPHPPVAPREAPTPRASPVAPIAPVTRRRRGGAVLFAAILVGSLALAQSRRAA